MEIHESARKHGVTDHDIRHALQHALVWYDLDPDDDPPRILAIGPDQAANLLELVLLDLADNRLLVIHAMPLRRSFHHLLPKEHHR